MRCFSYYFFITSFNAKYLVKYGIIFFFHILYRFNFNISCILSKSVNYFITYWNIFVSYGYSMKRFCLSNIIYPLSLIIFNIKILRRSIQKNNIQYFFSMYWCNTLLQYLLYLNISTTNILNIYYAYKLIHLIILFKNRFLHWNCTFSFPVKRNIITLLKSPHVHKKARDQYVHTNYKRTLEILNIPIRCLFLSTLYLQRASSIAIKLKSIIHFNFFF